MSAVWSFHRRIVQQILCVYCVATPSINDQNLYNNDETMMMRYKSLIEIWIFNELIFVATKRIIEIELNWFAYSFSIDIHRVRDTEILTHTKCCCRYLQLSVLLLCDKLWGCMCVLYKMNLWNKSLDGVHMGFHIWHRCSQHRFTHRLHRSCCAIRSYIAMPSTCELFVSAFLAFAYTSEDNGGRGGLPLRG